MSLVRRDTSEFSRSISSNSEARIPSMSPLIVFTVQKYEENLIQQNKNQIFRRKNTSRLNRFSDTEEGLFETPIEYIENMSPKTVRHSLEGANKPFGLARFIMVKTTIFGRWTPLSKCRKNLPKTQ